MANTRSEFMERFLVTATRLTREGARSTGSSVSSAVWAALGVLEAEGPHRISDLARAARISQPGMTKVVQNLVADEWVRRVADTDDSRAWLIVINDRGREALAGWRRRLAEATSELFGDLTDEEWAVIERADAILAARLARKEAAA